MWNIYRHIVFCVFQRRDHIYGTNNMLKWVDFSKPQEFRKRVVVSQFTLITFLLAYLEVTYCILRTSFPPCYSYVCTHQNVFIIYMTYGIELFQHIFVKGLKPSLKGDCWNITHCASYLHYAIPGAFTNKLTICILSNFRVANNHGTQWFKIHYH